MESINQLYNINNYKKNILVFSLFCHVLQIFLLLTNFAAKFDHKIHHTFSDNCDAFRNDYN